MVYLKLICSIVINDGFRYVYVFGWMFRWGYELERIFYVVYYVCFYWCFLRWIIGTLRILWVNYMFLSYIIEYIYMIYWNGK